MTAGFGPLDLGLVCARRDPLGRTRPRPRSLLHLPPDANRGLTGRANILERRKTSPPRTSLPLIGALADSSASCLGRRRLYMPGGCLVSVAGMLLLGYTRVVAATAAAWASSSNDRLTVALAVLSIFIIDLAANAVHHALPVDTLPPSAQAAGNACAALMLGTGSIVGFFVATLRLPTLLLFLHATSSLGAFAPLVSLLLACRLVTTLLVRERVLLCSSAKNNPSLITTLVERAHVARGYTPHSEFCDSLPFPFLSPPFNHYLFLNTTLSSFSIPFPSLSLSFSCVDLVVFCAPVLLHAPDWCLFGLGVGNTTLPDARLLPPCRVTRWCPSQPGRTARPWPFSVSTASWGPDVLAPPTVVVGVATGGHIYAAGSSGAIRACCHWTAQALPLLLAGLGRDTLPLLVTAVGLGLGLAHCRRRRGITPPLLFDALLLTLLDGDSGCAAAWPVACVFGWGGTGVVKRRVDGCKVGVVCIERHSSQSYRAASVRAFISSLCCVLVTLSYCAGSVAVCIARRDDAGLHVHYMPMMCAVQAEAVLATRGAMNDVQGFGNVASLSSCERRHVHFLQLPSCTINHGV
ncbi:hypothetical protein C8J57DRAFT_1719965, partial [Mycena rebaudengoi]